MLIKKKIILFVLGCFFAVSIACFVCPLRIMVLNSKVIIVEVAKNEAQRQKGLQNRASLRPNKGMLFVFEQEGWHSFWMKDTYIPLDIAFVDANKNIVDIQQMIPLDTQKHYQPAKAVKYALEVNAGWMQKNNVKVNDKVFFW